MHNWCFEGVDNFDSYDDRQSKLGILKLWVENGDYLDFCKYMSVNLSPLVVFQPYCALSNYLTVNPFRILFKR